MDENPLAIAGKRGDSRQQNKLWTLPVAWMLGGSLGLYQSAAVSLSVVSPLALIVIGLLLTGWALR